MGRTYKREKFWGPKRTKKVNRPKNKKAKLSKIRQKHPDQYDEDFGESFEKFRKKRW
tara:strand:+ start:327 stop:497 length:171 start_codon:yes stop_codon:yes gene_type:complete